MPRFPRVLCFGEALVDRLGPPGGDPATDRPVEDRLGGAPANVACALSRLGTPSALVGRLGDDSIGAAFIALLQERGVDCSALQRDRHLPSRTVLVRRDLCGDRSFGGFAGDRGEGFADQAIDAASLAPALTKLLPGARWLLAGTIPLASPAAAAALELAVEAASAHGVPLVLDINWRPTFWKMPQEKALERIRPLLVRAALLKFAAEEADWIAGCREPRRISASFPQAPAVVVTDGSAPLTWWLGGESGSQRAFPVPVVDTTGAGDAFLAGLLHRLCREPSLLQGAAPDRVGEAIRFASACGALVCRGAGAIDPQPGEVEVLEFLAAAGPPDHAPGA